jgi:ribosomal protein S18 acetylase RimI-like enzyme
VDVTLLSDRNEVQAYLDQVRAAADSERGSFGFLPKTAYEEFAAQGRMIVAVDAVSRSMLGYVVYGGAMPQGKIFQTWTEQRGRGRGVGRDLISEVVRRLERQHYLSVRADVAQDLSSANEFYAALGFETITVRPAKTAGRHINVRVRELATPSLLEMAADRSDPHGRLPISLPANSRVPLYLLDLNVLFDIAHARPQALYSGMILGAGFENEVRLAVSAELVVELERNTDPSSPDPILRFAASLPRLPLPPARALDGLVADLAPSIFPERAQAGLLKVQDKSDLTHLATAIHESATGFITSEKAILRAAETVMRKYGLQILSPEALGMSLGAEAAMEPPVDVWARGTGVRAHPLEDHDYGDAERLLIKRNLTATECRAALASGTATLPRRRHVVRVDGVLTAVGAWDAPSATGRARTLYVYVDEDDPAASLASDYLIRRAIADVGAVSPSVFELVNKAGQPSVRQAALASGFSRVPGSRSQTQRLQKVAAAKAIIPENWGALRDAIQSRVGLTLPAELPRYVSSSQGIDVVNEKGEKVAFTLAQLERLLSPLLLVAVARPAVVLPITQRYAEELFSGSAQPTFLAGREASLRGTRGYIGGRSSYAIVPEGGLALFYESGTGGGRKSITALARVTRKYLMSKESASETLEDKTVLEADTVRGLGRSGQVAVTEFDDLMLLRNPVRLSDLRKLGCVTGANFVTATRILHDQVVEIVKAGDPRA